MGVRFDFDFRQVCAVENAIQRGKICGLESVPTLCQLCRVAFDGSGSFRLRHGWLCIGLPDLAIQRGDLTVHSRERDFVGGRCGGTGWRSKNSRKLALESLNGIASLSGGLPAQLLQRFANRSGLWAFAVSRAV